MRRLSTQAKESGSRGGCHSEPAALVTTYYRSRVVRRYYQVETCVPLAKRTGTGNVARSAGSRVGIAVKLRALAGSTCQQSSTL
jgi:hypothetical protein